MKIELLENNQTSGIKMKSLIAIILMIVLISLPVYGKGKVGSINEGQTAPYSGFLYDFEANAELLDKARGNLKLATLKRDLEVEKATLVCKRDLAICGKYKFRILSKDKEIAMLESELQSEWKAPAYIAGGVVIGAGLTLLVFYLTIKVDNEKN